MNHTFPNMSSIALPSPPPPLHFQRNFGDLPEVTLFLLAQGGGIHVYSSGTVTFTSSNIYNNEAANVRCSPPFLLPP